MSATRRAILMDDELWRDLTKRAKSLGMNTSEYIRLVLSQHKKFKIKIIDD